ncbi:MAG: flavodoxin [Tissierellia bacterium]|nr:flavodoxin [Tissierellia bacterium]
MKKINVIYWSGTGNTEAMAEAIIEGIKEAGCEANLIQVDDATMEDVTGADAVAFGCPAMGDEELEEGSFRPFMDEANENIDGKKVAIFGSYEWNEGQWMDYWTEEIEKTGCILVRPGLIAYDNPDDEALQKCRDLGKALCE